MSNLQARVAIVDDDAAVRKALSRLVEASSFNAEIFASAHEFLASLPERVPACLIVDLQMPEMTGLELQFHLARAGFRIPTIVITAHNESGARERCLSAGASAFLQKPMQEKALIEAINGAIGHT